MKFDDFIPSACDILLRTFGESVQVKFCNLETLDLVGIRGQKEEVLSINHYTDVFDYEFSLSFKKRDIPHPENVESFFLEDGAYGISKYDFREGFIKFYLRK